MGDDGKGKSVHIPGVLISKKDGEILKTYYKNNKEHIKNKPIYLEIDFEMETDVNVSFDVYFESDDFNILKVIRNLKPYLNKLGKTVNFEPRFLTYPHPDFNFTEFNKVDSYDCISGGRYCVSPRRNNLNGRAIIITNLKLKCAYTKAEENKEKFFNFLSIFIDDCLGEDKENYFSESCMAISFQKAGYEIKEINLCYANSFVPSGI
jgi:hypothetical protein